MLADGRGGWIQRQQKNTWYSTNMSFYVIDSLLRIRIRRIRMFDHQAKIVRKTLLPTVLWILFIFYLRKIEQHPDPDPLVIGMDPRIRIRIKLSWIRNTEKSSGGKGLGCPPACWRRGWRAGRGRGGSCRCSKYSYSASVTSHSSTTSQPDREYLEENHIRFEEPI